jgi:hypothetical protein
LGLAPGEKLWRSTTSFLKIYPVAERKLKSRRKERLFAVACCRRLGNLLADPRCVAGVDAAERYADSELDKDGLKVVKKEVTAAARATGKSKPTGGSWTPADAVQMATSLIRSEVLVTAPIRIAIFFNWMKIRTRAEEEAIQVDLLRDVFGNPFRKVKFSPAWRTDTAVSLARTMYDSREFGAMPILADALQDAGCDNETILAQCRDTALTHVRGCWVVDLVLGKE